jgi:hypothetical protein
MVSGFFTSSPTNAVVPGCNTVVTTAYSDSAMNTLETTGNTVITQSLDWGSWDQTSPSTVDTSTSTSWTIYYKGTHGGSTQSVSKTLTIAICNGETVTVSGESNYIDIYTVG